MRNMKDSLLSMELTGVEFSTYPTFEHFDVFQNNLMELQEYISEEFILEAMQDSKKTTWQKIKSINGPLKSTRDTTRDVVDSYDTLTDAGGTFLKSVWDLVVKAMNLSVRIARFILTNLSKIPKAIISVGKSFTEIPSEIKRKVRGDIKLYITVEDLNNLHKIVIPQIDIFLKNAYEMSRGDVWGTFFRRRAIGDGMITKLIFTENDMKYYRKMKNSYNRIKLIDFSKTLVKISDQNVIDIYFGDAESVQFNSADRGKVKSSYYDALVEVFTIFRDQQEYIKYLAQDFDMKTDASKMNQNFNKINESTRKTVIDAIQMNAKMINIIGNLLQYTITDMHTLKGVANKLLKAADVKRVKTP